MAPDVPVGMQLASLYSVLHDLRVTTKKRMKDIRFSLYHKISVCSIFLRKLEDLCELLWIRTNECKVPNKLGHNHIAFDGPFAANVGISRMRIQELTLSARQHMTTSHIEFVATTSSHQQTGLFEVGTTNNFW